MKECRGTSDECEGEERVEGQWQGFVQGQPISAPLLFTANDCLDIGIALGSPVSLDYFHRAPFKFNGRIESVHVQYTT